MRNSHIIILAINQFVMLAMPQLKIPFSHVVPLSYNSVIVKDGRGGDGAMATSKVYSC